MISYINYIVTTDEWLHIISKYRHLALQGGSIELVRFAKAVWGHAWTWKELLLTLWLNLSIIIRIIQDCKQNTKVRLLIASGHNLSQFSNCHQMLFNNLPQFSNCLKLRQVLRMVWVSAECFEKLRQVLRMVWDCSEYFEKLQQRLKWPMKAKKAIKGKNFKK